MRPRTAYALGIFLAAMVAGTLVRVVLGRSLVVDAATAALVIVAIVVAVVVSREPRRAA